MRISLGSLASAAVTLLLFPLVAPSPARAEETGAVTDGLVLWYKLDEKSGASATDSSGRDRNGTVAGTASWTGGDGDWDASQRTGSKSIMVWESTDLVNWTDQRLVKISPDTAGNTWAPEAYYDSELGAYVVFWASKLYADNDPNHTGSTYNKMMYATTRDFRTFSEAKVWVDPGYSVIDSTMIDHNGTYYRFTKDERNNSSTSPCSKFIIDVAAVHSAAELDGPLPGRRRGRQRRDDEPGGPAARRRGSRPDHYQGGLDLGEGLLRHGPGGSGDGQRQAADQTLGHGTVLLGSTAVGSGTLSAGKVTVKLARNIGVGTRKLRVVYLGDNRYAGSVTDLTLKVVTAASKTRPLELGSLTSGNYKITATCSGSGTVSGSAGSAITVKVTR